MTITPPSDVPNVAFPVGSFPGNVAPYSNVTPFTHRDARTMQGQTEALIQWINTSFIEWNNDQINLLVDDVNKQYEQFRQAYVDYMASVGADRDHFAEVVAEQYAEFEASVQAVSNATAASALQAATARAASERARDEARLAQAAVPDNTTAARQRKDSGSEALAAKLELGTEDIVLSLLGDSTGNDGNEWFKLWVNELATKYPAARVEYSLWADGTQSYPPLTVVGAGTGYSPGGARTGFYDNFRTVGPIVGSTPAIGEKYTGTSTARSDGTKAILTTANAADAISDTGRTGDGTITASNVTMNTSNANPARQIKLYGKYVDGQNQVYVYVNVNQLGLSSWGIFKRIGNVPTLMVAGGALNLTANADNTFDMVLDIKGKVVTATVKGVTATANLTDDDLDALTNSHKVGFGAASTAGDTGTVTVESIRYEMVANSIGQRIVAYNGSVPGSTSLYNTDARIPLMVPTRPDFVFVSFGHNHNGSTGRLFTKLLGELKGRVRAVYPDARFAFMSQNPEFAPFTFGSEHRRRFVSLRAWALENGDGYLPVFEEFDRLPDKGASLVQSDGIHPLPDGSALWRSIVSRYLSSKMFMPTV